MRWVRRILVTLVVLALALGAYGFVLVRRSFPQIEGQVALRGLEAAVDIIRDVDGVPHIYATNLHDLFFAQGYVHAQDRFWQMDFWRHIGSARLSELFGEGQLGTDRFLKTLGFAKTAEIEYAMVPDEVRLVLDSYAEGVNAYIRDRTGSRLSLEYAILPLQSPGYEPEPWHPVHTLTWAKVMAWDLRANLVEEIERAVLAQTLPPGRVEQLYPPYPEGFPVIVPSVSPDSAHVDPGPVVAASAALASVAAGMEAVDNVTGGSFAGMGSNNWVVHGSRTASGMPLLANDPHLPIQMPSIWYEVSLHCVPVGEECPYEVAGVGFPGTPGVVVGHNVRIAWGVTNQAPDTMDLYLERVNPDNPNQYDVEGEWVDMEIDTEAIRVAGGEEVALEVRSTRHGPVVSGVYAPVDEFETERFPEAEELVVTLRWQALEPSTLIEAILALNVASGYADFRAAAAKWDIAAQNLVYADVEGNIAYQATGAIPIRSSGDGRYPVPGWDSEYEWVGTIPFEDLPALLNPRQGFIATANQPVVDAGYDGFIGIDHAYGYRAKRINDLLDETDQHDAASMRAIQLDTQDGGAMIVVPHLLEVVSDDQRVTTIQGALREWSQGDYAYMAGHDSIGAAAYQATWRHLLRLTFDDELPEDYEAGGGSRWFEVVRVLLTSPDDAWWDVMATPQREQMQDVLAAAMVAAHDELTDLLGSDMSRWSWGRLHTAAFENQTFGQSGIAPIEWLFNRSAPPQIGGSSSIVNATAWFPPDGYRLTDLPSMRMIIDLADFSASQAIHTTGQSGHAFHPHYDDFIEPWTDGGYHPMRWRRDQIEAGAEGVLTLGPE